jgi:hypothetical protein
MIYNSGSLMMYFTLPLAEPIDPFAGEFVYRIYDPSFFIAIDFAETKPLAALGNLPEPCAIELRPPPTGAEIESTRICWPKRMPNGSRRRSRTSVPCSPSPSPSCASRSRAPDAGRAASRRLRRHDGHARGALAQAPAALAAPDHDVIVTAETRIDPSRLIVRPRTDNEAASVARSHIALRSGRLDQGKAAGILRIDVGRAQSHPGPVAMVRRVHADGDELRLRGASRRRPRPRQGRRLGLGSCQRARTEARHPHCLHERRLPGAHRHRAGERSAADGARRRHRGTRPCRDA